MIRNIKIFGLSLFAVLAFGVITAAGASAKTGLFTFGGSGPWTLDVTETGEALDNSFTAFGTVTDCTNVTYAAGSTLSGAVSLTVTPTYESCTTTKESSTFSTTISMNSCDYEFGAEKALDPTDHTWTATATLDCETSAGPHISLYSSGSHALRVCTIELKPANHLPEHNLHFTNTTPEVGKKDLDLKGTVTFHAVKSGLCGAATETQATYHADITVSLTDNAKKSADLTISTQP